MSRTKQIAAVLAVAFVLTFGFSGLALAETSPAGSAEFEDFDGDGFDDNAPDTDSDGIPDAADQSKPETLTDQANDGGFISFDSGETALPDDVGSFSSRFERLSFTCRALTKTRGGFGSSDDFGPGNGIGIGAVSAGGCSGGICTP